MSAFLLVVLTAALAQDQPPPAAEQRKPPTSAAEVMEKMKALEFLAGDWEGEGTYEFGPDQKRSFKIAETATPKLGGKAILIEGRGTATADGGKEVVIHEALAILTWDAVHDKYAWLPVTAREGYVEAHVEVSKNKIVWGFDDPRGPKIRFTITVNDKGEWSEVGESSVDSGKTWHKFMDMTLTRKK